MSDGNYDELGQILAKLFLSEPGKSALEMLAQKYDVATVFDNEKREYWNAGRRSVIRDIKQLIKQSKQAKEQ